MTHRPYPNAARALHQAQRGRRTPEPSALQVRLAEGARHALKLAGEMVIPAIKRGVAVERVAVELPAPGAAHAKPVLTIAGPASSGTQYWSSPEGGA